MFQRRTFFKRVLKLIQGVSTIGVIYTGDAGDMSPPLFEMADFVPTTFWKHLVKMFWKIKRTKKC